MNLSRRKYVVIVEDNPDHQMLISRVIRRSIFSPDVLVLNDGEEAINFANQPGRTPDLIILDIKIPKFNGLEVLKVFKRSEKLLTTPIVLMTTSSMRSDIVTAYANGASSYISKSDNMLQWNKRLSEALSYWLGINKTDQSLGVH